MSALGSNYWLQSCPVAELVQSTGLVHFQGQFYLLVVLAVLEVGGQQEGNCVTWT